MIGQMHHPRNLLDITFLASYLELTFGADAKYFTVLDSIGLVDEQEAYIQLIMDGTKPGLCVLTRYEPGLVVTDLENIGGFEGAKKHFGEDSVFKYREVHRLRDEIAKMDGFDIVHRVNWMTWPMQYILSLHWSYPSDDEQLLSFIREAVQDLNYDDVAEAVAKGYPEHTVTIAHEEGFVIGTGGPFYSESPSENFNEDE